MNAAKTMGRLNQPAYSALMAIRPRDFSSRPLVRAGPGLLASLWGGVATCNSTKVLGTFPTFMQTEKYDFILPVLSLILFRDLLVSVVSLFFDSAQHARALHAAGLPLLAVSRN